LGLRQVKIQKVLTGQTQKEEVSADEKVQNTNDGPEIFDVENLTEDGLDDNEDEDLQSEYVKETEHVDKSTQMHYYFIHDSTRIESNE
jgi:hypothetical protein